MTLHTYGLFLLVTEYQGEYQNRGTTHMKQLRKERSLGFGNPKPTLCSGNPRPKPSIIGIMEKNKKESIGVI